MRIGFSNIFGSFKSNTKEEITDAFLKASDEYKQYLKKIDYKNVINRLEDIEGKYKEKKYIRVGYGLNMMLDDFKREGKANSDNEMFVKFSELFKVACKLDLV